MLFHVTSPPAKLNVPSLLNVLFVPKVTTSVELLKLMFPELMVFAPIVHPPIAPVVAVMSPVKSTFVAVIFPDASNSKFAPLIRSFVPSHCK